MDFTKLIKKVNEKLAAQSHEETFLQCFDGQIGNLALNCVKNAGIKDEILGALGKGEQFVKDNPSVGGGIAGAVGGGIIGSQTGSKGDFETDDDYASRNRNSILTGALAGVAAGASVPSLVNSFSSAVGANEGAPSLMDKLKSLVISPSVAVAGAGAGFGVHYMGKAQNELESRISEAGEAIKGKMDPEDLLSARNHLKEVTGAGINPIGDAVANRYLRAVTHGPLEEGATSGGAKILKTLLSRRGLGAIAGAGTGLLGLNALANTPYFSQNR